MKKNYFLTIILLATVIVLGGCNMIQPKNTPAPITHPLLNLPPNQNINNSVTPPAVNLNQPVIPPPAGNLNQPILPPPGAEVPPSILQNVQIQNFAFSPATLTIKVGTSVTWTNNDNVPHAIAGTGFTSQTLNKGETFSNTFYQSGTYNYHCAIHPFMTGTINVTK